VLLAHPQEFAGEDSRLGRGLFGLRRVALGALGGLQDQVAGLGVEGFEVEDFAVEFTLVGAHDLGAFPLLFEGCVNSCWRGGFTCRVWAG